ncbi:kinase interacting family protein [Abeliophyllum distichum]|uniref:Kinase interacting family protein n=1 Tax=Abeliophyllum distichum TaxID=126358 RepID=A0ABD1TKE6_9LAMI
MKIENTKDVREEGINEKSSEESVCNQQGEGKEDELDWQQKLMNGMEDREKIFLTEYATILKNYKDVKRKLNDMEKKDLESQSDMAVRVREIRDTIAKERRRNSTIKAKS